MGEAIIYTLFKIIGLSDIIPVNSTWDISHNLFMAQLEPNSTIMDGNMIGNGSVIL